MLKKLLIFLMIVCLGQPQTHWISWISYKGASIINNKQEVAKAEQEASEASSEDAYDPTMDPSSDKFEPEKYYNISVFADQSLGGYKISIPASHFTLVDSESTNLEKVVTYKDTKSVFKIGYTISIVANADVPGYLTNGLFKLNSTTNDRETYKFGDTDWTRIRATTTDKGNTQYIWYTQRNDSDGTISAFWIEGSVYPESDNDEMQYAVQAMMKTYSYDLTSSGTVFDQTGAAAVDSEKYIANSSDHTIFSDRSGIIADSGLSDDWRDLEFSIDGSKFALPCRLQVFEDAGFTINEQKTDAKTIIVNQNQVVSVDLINNHGTRLSVYAYNEDQSEAKTLNDCNIVKVIIDPSKFVSEADAAEKLKELNETSSTENSSTGSSEVDTSLTSNANESIPSSYADEPYMYKMSDGGYMNATPAEGSDNADIFKPKAGDPLPDVYGNSYVIKTSGYSRDYPSVITGKMVEKITSGTEIVAVGDALTATGDLWVCYINSDNKQCWYPVTDIENVKDESDESSTENTQIELPISDVSSETSSETSTESSETSTESTETSEEGSSTMLGNDSTAGLHEIILPGGVTTSAYTDDIIAKYGDCDKQMKTVNGVQYYVCTWTYQQETFELTLQTYQGIVSIEMSSMNVSN